MDTQLFFLINGYHTPYLDQLMFLISQKAVWIPLYASLLYVVWRNYSWRGLLTVLLMVGIGMLITDWANAHLLRPWIGRLRPSNPDNPISSMVHIVNGRRGSGCGFPSAHAANIWLLTLLMFHWFRDGLLSLTMVVVAVAVCYSRIYLGYHYPGDILGGIVLAYLTAWLLTWLHCRLLHFKHKFAPVHTRVVAVVAALTAITFAAQAYISL
ncbi:MAG: phosphatase PAP2 family protein [Prevotellaceae bacterium]|nr:phosphatase PAP2 family protein [Prevotellaceae bacterium]MDY2749289.1 phosphatase PAP2 family protein [Prevotella sp.]